MITSFGGSIYTSKINIDEAEMDQSNLLKQLVAFTEKSKPRTKEGLLKTKKKTFESKSALYKGQELIINAFKSGIFPIKETQGKGRPSNLATRLQILTPKQMLERLSIALAQVKIGNTSENLLNETRQIIYSLDQAKKS